MASPALMGVVKRLFEEYPLVPVIIFIGMGAGSGYAGWKSWDEAANFRAISEEMTLERAIPLAASGHTIVTLTGLEWKCSDVLEDESKNTIPLIDAVTNGLVIYQGGSGARCEGLAGKNPTGLLTAVDPVYHKSLMNKKWPILATFPIEKIWTLCSFCGSENSLQQTKVFGGFMAFCVLCALFYLRRLTRTVHHAR